MSGIFDFTPPQNIPRRNPFYLLLMLNISIRSLLYIKTIHKSLNLIPICDPIFPSIGVFSNVFQKSPLSIEFHWVLSLKSHEFFIDIPNQMPCGCALFATTFDNTQSVYRIRHWNAYTCSRSRYSIFRLFPRSIGLSFSARMHLHSFVSISVFIYTYRTFGMCSQIIRGNCCSAHEPRMNWIIFHDYSSELFIAVLAFSCWSLARVNMNCGWILCRIGIG